MNKIIFAKDLEKKFGELIALNKVNLEVTAGEVIVLIGPSGSGKSTLLRSLIQLEKIDAGEIVIDNLSIVRTNEEGDAEYASKKIRQQAKLKMGMVFQNFPLFPHLSVLENLIEAPLRIRKISKVQATTETMLLLEKIGLQDRCTAYPFELSGGQKQRIALIRALAMQPEIMLFDEPTSALDPELVNSMISVIKALVIDKNKTVIITTHQLNFAAEIADRLIFMDQGTIIEAGEPRALLDNPKSERLQRFLEGNC